MKSRSAFAFIFPAAVLMLGSFRPSPAQSVPQGGFGFTDFSSEAQQEQKFLAVPDPKQAGDDLTTLTPVERTDTTWTDPPANAGGLNPFLCLFSKSTNP